MTSGRSFSRCSARAKPQRRALRDAYAAALDDEPEYLNMLRKQRTVNCTLQTRSRIVHMLRTCASCTERTHKKSV
jgi:hypothetical protein